MTIIIIIRDEAHINYTYTDTQEIFTEKPLTKKEVTTKCDRSIEVIRMIFEIIFVFLCPLIYSDDIIVNI